MNSNILDLFSTKTESFLLWKIKQGKHFSVFTRKKESWNCP